MASDYPDPFLATTARESGCLGGANNQGSL